MWIKDNNTIPKKNNKLHVSSQKGGVLFLFLIGIVYFLHAFNYFNSWVTENEVLVGLQMLFHI